MPPAEIGHNQAAYEEWSKLPHIAALAAQGRRFRFAMQPDGKWVAENVLPGVYDVEVHAFHSPQDGESRGRWLGMKAKVVIPGEPANGTLDLGDIELQLLPTQPPQ